MCICVSREMQSATGAAGPTLCADGRTGPKGMVISTRSLFHPLSLFPPFPRLVRRVLLVPPRPMTADFNVSTDTYTPIPCSTIHCVVAPWALVVAISVYGRHRWRSPRGNKSRAVNRRWEMGRFCAQRLSFQRHRHVSPPCPTAPAQCEELTLSVSADSERWKPNACGPCPPVAQHNPRTGGSWVSVPHFWGWGAAAGAITALRVISPHLPPLSVASC